MRRALLLTGLAAGVLLIAANMANSQSVKVDKIQDFKEKLSDIAFCQKGYEIASSFPSYASRHAPTLKARIDLLQESDALQAKSERLQSMFEGPFKEEAKSLGIETFDFSIMVRHIQDEAERSAVVAYEQVEEPEEFLNRLDSVCSIHLK